MAVRPADPDPRVPKRWPDVPMQARTRRRIAVAVPLILALAAGIYAARWIDTGREANEPVEAVRAFLEASRSGEVETALALTTGDPHGASDLLVPEATSTDWEVLGVGLQSWSPYTDYATVWATIKGPNDTELTTVFDLGSVGGGWKIADPFTTLTIDATPVPYVDVNGFTLPMATEPFESYDFALLPGVYELYEDPPELLAYEAAPLLALGERLVNADGSESPVLRETFEGFTAVEGDEPELNARLTAYLDACMADPEGPETFGCPFNLRQGDIDDPDFTLGDDNRWEIIEYPQATATGFGGPVYTEDFVIGLLTRKEGRSRVTAVDSATGRQIVLECPITTNGLYLVFDTTGAYGIGPNQDPNPPTESDLEAWGGNFGSWCEAT
jgi:hypothetical protein